MKLYAKKKGDRAIDQHTANNNHSNTENIAAHHQSTSSTDDISELFTRTRFEHDTSELKLQFLPMKPLEHTVDVTENGYSISSKTRNVTLVS